MESVGVQRNESSWRGWRWILLLLIFAAMTSTAFANKFAQLQNASLFTDTKAHQVGDILTVLIVESASAQNAVKTDVQKSSEFNLDAGPGFGSIDFIPLFGASGTSDNKTGNQGSTSRSGQLKAQMTVQVVGVRENGDLIIEGSRVIGINSDKEMLTLTGIVRSEDVQPDNTIYSYQIAEAQINYRGKGAAANGGKPGWIMRFLNWIF